MTYRIDRRRLMQAGSTLALASILPAAACVGVAEAPISPYGETSTADQVTEGLDLTGKTALITGVNSGIGYETMKTLALRGAHVIGAARTMEKAQTACDSVEGKTTPVVCELTDFGSVAACADTVKAQSDTIDMLICNAGVMALPELEQVNGIEKQFTINHLGHYILTRRLLDQVKAAEQGRVVMVSSMAYQRAPEAGIEFDNLSGERDYDPWTAYGQTKLANALFARELARRLRRKAATANAIHPGVVQTNLGRYLKSVPEDLMKEIQELYMKTAAEGAATQTYVATSPGLAKVSGVWFEDCNPVTPEGPHMQNDALAAKLWDVSEGLTKDYLG